MQTRQWFVLYVNSRSEKKTASLLQKMGFEVFCPLKTEYRQWSDRMKKVEVPYFSSYVFAKFKEKEVEQVLQTRGVVRRLFWLGKPAVVRNDEMQEVQAFFNDYKEQNICRETLEVGDTVEIVQGDFQNRKAVVLQQNTHQVTLNLLALNCKFKVILNKDKVEKIK